MNKKDEMKKFELLKINSSLSVRYPIRFWNYVTGKVKDAKERKLNG